MNQALVAIEDLDPNKDLILRVEWNLGKRCNFDCSYCGPETHNTKSPHLEEKILQKTILRLKTIGDQQKKRIKLSLTGGEPYLHPRFIDMLRFAKQNGIHKLSVTTNGSLHIKQYIESLPLLDHIIISYHPEYVQKEKILSNILDIKAHIDASGRRDLNMHVHFMLLPDHFEEISRCAEILNKKKIAYAYRRIRPRYDLNGQLIRPYHKTASVKESPYYSTEELDWMKSLK